MERCSIKYYGSNYVFVIQNLYKNKLIDDKNQCLIKNIKNKIQNCKYEDNSSYLKEKINISKYDKYKEIGLIDKQTPRWINTIKGDDEKMYYPAKDFYENILPNICKEYEFIQKLVMPEANINEIVGYDNEHFTSQHVDFYIPCCKLVIEIDGYHHRRKVQKYKDNKRDEYLLENNIKTVRIKTIEIKNKNKSFEKKINLIINQLQEYNESLMIYKRYYNIKEYDEEEKKYLKLNAVIRFKMTMLSVLEEGILSLDDCTWKLNVLTRDIQDFIEIAIDDLLLDIEKEALVNEIIFKRPKIEIVENKSTECFIHKDNYINIDFSLNKRWTDENILHEKTIFVRTDYY